MREAPTRLAWLPTGTELLVQREPDGFADVALGSLRLQVRDDEVGVAADQPAAAIVLAGRAARGWVFIDAAGTALAAPDFLGPLTRVGAFPGFRDGLRFHGPDDGMGQRGRVALVDRRRVAWMSDGGVFVPVAALEGERVEEILFVSEREGVAWTEGGALRCTRDGGAHWTAVGGGHDGATSLRVGADGVLTDPGGRSVATSDCRLVPVAAVDAPPRNDDFTTERGRGLSTEWHAGPGLPWLLARRDPAWICLLHGIARPDGTLVVHVGRDLSIVEGRTARGLTRFRLDDHWSGIANAGHLLRITSGGGTEDAPAPATTTFVDPRARSGEVIPSDRVPAGMTGALPSDRADLAVGDGPCGATPSHRALCRYDTPTSEGVTREVARPYTGLLGLSGSRALLALSAHALGVVDVGAAVDPIPVTPVFTTNEYETVSATVGEGGVVTALVTRAGSLRGAAVGLLGDPLTVVDLPPDVDRAVFADPAHGYAWSAGFERVARTRDGGRHWEALPAVDGRLPDARAGAEAPDADRSSVPDSLACTLDRCLLGGVSSSRVGAHRARRGPSVRGAAGPADAATPAARLAAPVVRGAAGAHAAVLAHGRGASRDRATPTRARDAAAAQRAHRADRRLRYLPPVRPAPVLLLAALALAAPASAQREPPDPLFIPAEMPTGRGWFCFTHRRAGSCFRRAGLCGDTLSGAIAPHVHVAYSCGPPRTTAHCLRVEWRWGPYVRCAPTAALCRAERRRLTTPPPPHQPGTPDLPPPTGVSRCHAVGDVPSRASTAQGDAQPEG